MSSLWTVLARSFEEKTIRFIKEDKELPHPRKQKSKMKIRRNRILRRQQGLVKSVW